MLKHRQFRRLHQSLPSRKLAQRGQLPGLGLMLENFRCWKAGTFLNQLKMRFQQAGNPYSATVAAQRLIFTIEPEDIKAIFADRFDDFGCGWLRRRNFAPAIGDVLIIADGPRWRHQRAMLRPAFNKQQFSDYGFFKHDIDRLVACVPFDGSTIDLAPLFHVHALIMASRLLFDEPMGSLNPEFIESSDRFLTAFAQVNKGHERRTRLGRFLPLQPRDYQYEAGCKVVHEYADSFVNRALEYRNVWGSEGVDEDTKERYIFLREIAKDISDPAELRKHLLRMLLVGSETSANLLTGCLGLLSSRPKLWNELREEALNIPVLSFETVGTFKSLRNLINEGRSFLDPWSGVEGNIYSASPIPHTTLVFEDGQQGHVSTYRRRQQWHISPFRTRSHPGHNQHP